MAGSINNFKASFKQDIARPNRFDVNIPVPIGLLPFARSARDLTYRCENANLPGRTFATTEQKTYGPIEKSPYLTTYNDMDLTFIVDDDMSQKVLFDSWLNFINPQYNNNYRYKDDYVTTITVNQYDVTNEVSYSINLYNAFPVSVNQLDLDWSSDGHHKLVVTFAYTYWKNNSVQAFGVEMMDYTLGSIGSGTTDSTSGPSSGISTGLTSLLNSAGFRTN
jgi:hypothetical protein